MESIWNQQTEKPKFETLEGDVKTDVLIIGGGMAGILCGYMLKNAGVDCIIAEARDICGGVTQCTTAKVTYHHGAIFDKMIRRYGREKTKLYIEAEREALAEGFENKTRCFIGHRKIREKQKVKEGLEIIIEHLISDGV